MAEDGAVGESLELTRTESASSPNAEQARVLRAAEPAAVRLGRAHPAAGARLGGENAGDAGDSARHRRGARDPAVAQRIGGERGGEGGGGQGAGQPGPGRGSDRVALGARAEVPHRPHRSVRPAGTTGSWAEVWRLDLGPVWHAQTTGIPPIHPGGGGGPRLRTWRPWPGETVSISVTRPAGVPGRTFTIDRSELALRPGARSTEATLTLQIRSSRGGEHTVSLPDSSTLESLQIDGSDQPLRLDGRRVTLPLAPGARSFRLGFRTLAPLAPRLQHARASTSGPRRSTPICSSRCRPTGGC